ncbi:MAG: SURF1 family protein [Acidimicrobiales bacterium]|nr:SURF1 family protein [Acidimicrobiales bacterium]MYD83096.1 SURF1 family protein [Acidimicrobiales bacterium]MYJ65602.1 SURF1 family protein [Acidimicrobiales bacterium]
MYSFARKPIWLAGHALAGGLLVIFVIAGFWQLSRHHEVSDRNAAIAERTEMPPLDADRFFDAVNDADLPDELEHRLVTLPIDEDGWDYGHELVQIRHRSLNGAPGCHVAKPVAAAPNDLAEPNGVLVVEGWLPQRTCTAWLDGEVGVFGSMAGAAQITGRIRFSQERGLLGPSDPAQGQLDTLARTDVERINQQTTLDLVPVYVELVSARRASGSRIKLGVGIPGLPVPQPVPPDLDAGPHLGYTFQWFSFAAVAIVGYTLVLRHQARKGDSEQIADD